MKRSKYNLTRSLFKVVHTFMEVWKKKGFKKGRNAHFCFENFPQNASGAQKAPGGRRAPTGRQ